MKHLSVSVFVLLRSTSNNFNIGAIEENDCQSFLIAWKLLIEFGDELVGMERSLWERKLSSKEFLWQKIFQTPTSTNGLWWRLRTRSSQRPCYTFGPSSCGLRTSWKIERHSIWSASFSITTFGKSLPVQRSCFTCPGLYFRLATVGHEAFTLLTRINLVPSAAGWVCDEADRGSYEHIPDVQKFWFWGNMAVLFLRTSEYLETVWFILRKKQGQVTVLHVFHHIAVTFLLWIFGKYGLERNGGFVIVVNSLVHVIMYGYYIVSSIESTRKRAMKYKSHMTIFQIIQLIVLFGHSIRMIVACNAPLYYRLLAPSVGILIVLFTNFYVRTYVLKRKVKSN